MPMGVSAIDFSVCLRSTARTVGRTVVKVRYTGISTVLGPPSDKSVLGLGVGTDGLRGRHVRRDPVAVDQFSERDPNELDAEHQQ